MIVAMTVGVILGFILPSPQLAFLIIPILFVVLTVTLRNVKIHGLTKKEKKVVPKLLLTHYVISALMVLATYLFVKNPDYRAGMYLVALIPPAIATIPLTYIFHGEMKESIFTEVIALLAALIVVPLFSYFLIGSAVSVIQILKILIVLVVFPLIASRILRKIKWKIFNQTKIIVSLLFGLLVYINASLLDMSILYELPKLAPILIIHLVTIFGTGTFMFFMVRNKRDRVDYLLFASSKNTGAALAIALVTVGVAATVPSILRILLAPPSILYFTWLIGKYNHVKK